MDRTELDIGAAGPAPRKTPRRAALDALERLLRAHVALSAERSPESPYGILRPAREEELDLIEAVFVHSGVPLPETLRAIYRRTLGVGNPVSALPVLAVPFLRAELPDEGLGLGGARVGIEAFERALGLWRDEAAVERPPVLAIGHGELAGLTGSRNGLWSLADHQGAMRLPPAEDFRLVFDAAFCALVDQVLLVWANDLAGAPVRPRDLDLRGGARLGAMPDAIRDAMARLLAPQPLQAASWGDVRALDQGDLLRATRRAEEGAISALHGGGVPVVGLPYADFPRAAGRIGPGTRLRLHPVEDNPHDDMAVEAWLDDGEPLRLGFVARQAAPHVRALPGGAAAWRLRVLEMSDQVLACALERIPPDMGAATADGTGTDAPPDLFARLARSRE